MEVIVVDNASREDEATVIEKRYPQVKVVRSPQNLGFAGGNNLGIQAAHGKYLFFTNNDTLLRHQTSDIRLLVSRLESDAKIGAVCPKIRFTWGNNPIQYAGYTPLSRITLRNRSIGFGEEDKGQYDMAHKTPYAHGAAMLVKREAIDKAGMMPECYFLYYEELDWSLMIRRAGFDIWYEPACTIYHKESQATGQQSPLRTYYITRNRPAQRTWMEQVFVLCLSNRTGGSERHLQTPCPQAHRPSEGDVTRRLSLYKYVVIWTSGIIYSLLILPCLSSSP